MTRPKNPAAIEKEARLQEAITAVLKKKHTCNSAANAFNVPRRTLYHRVKENMQSRNKAHEDKQLLSHAEEKELVRWITRLTTAGYPPRHATLREMADEIRKRRVQNDREQPELFPIGKQWTQHFLRWHVELSTITLRSIDAVRMKDSSPERLSQWFVDLEKVITEYNIDVENIYNMDKSGFSIEEIDVRKQCSHIQSNSLDSPLGF